MSGSPFTHNLAISMIDIECNDDTLPSVILEEFKQRISEIPKIYRITYKRFLFNAIIHWKRVPLGTPFCNMMGDLFTSSPYPDDEMIHCHTKEILSEIDKDLKDKYPYTQWCLVFHLTKIVSLCIPSDMTTT